MNARQKQNGPGRFIEGRALTMGHVNSVWYDGQRHAQAERVKTLAFLFRGYTQQGSPPQNPFLESEPRKTLFERGLI